MSVKQVLGGIATIMAAALASAPAHALFEDDVHISSDRDSVSLDVDRRAFNEMRFFFEQGYPAHSIFLHGIGTGLSIDDLVFLAVRADPANAERLVDTAIRMLPTLPAWACRDGVLTAEDRYAPVYSADQLGQPITIGEIAERFFTGNARLTPFPDWTGGAAHVSLPVSELQGYASPETWYRVGREDRPGDHPLIVSLYRDQQRVVLDGNLGQLRRAIAEGQDSIDAVILYNEDYVRPVSDFGDDPTVSDIAGSFFANGIQLTHVPNWRGPFGDYHEQATIDELAEFVEIPAPEDIEESRWEKTFNELSNNGFRDKPVMISLYHNDQKLWVDQPERLAAARELGMSAVPVVYLYHGIQRLPCGVAPGSDCEDRIRKAAGLAGAPQAAAPAAAQPGIAMPAGSPGSAPGSS